MNAFYQDIREATPKRWLAILLAMLGASAVVAVFQSVKFSSSLWVVTEFGFVYWQEHITRMLGSLVPWAAVTGVVFALQFMAPATTTQESILLRSVAMGFFGGFLLTYLHVAVLGIAIYPALGILSFIFPDQVVFGSLGFAVLCAMYIVFLMIVTDTPPLLLEVVRRAPLYFKLLGVLLTALLAVQVLSSLVGGLIIMVDHSTWRVHLWAFVIAFGGTLLATVFLNLAILKEGPPGAKVLRIATAFVLAIIAGNMSEAALHWGEYASALFAAVPGSAAASAFVLGLQRSPAKAVLAVAGLFLGVGIGLLVAHTGELKIVGQDWFGVLCGSAIALGLGGSFGMILVPALRKAAARLMGTEAAISSLVGASFVSGVMMGVLAGALTNG